MTGTPVEASLRDGLIREIFPGLEAHIPTYPNVSSQAVLPLELCVTAIALKQTATVYPGHVLQKRLFSFEGMATFITREVCLITMIF